MSAREHYVIFPTDYYDELIGSGQRKKAAALMEYFRDMKRKRVYKYTDYADYWFGDYKRKGDAFRWIKDFKREIGLFFAYWHEQNEAHFLDVESPVKPNRNRSETENVPQSPQNRDLKKSSETGVKPNRNISKESNKEYIYTPNDLTIAKHLFNKLKTISPTMKEPNFDKWADHVRLMVERDGREYEKIKNVIDFIFDDNDIYDGTFWRGNIRSTEKLRKQYDTIALQINVSYKKAG